MFNIVAYLVTFLSARVHPIMLPVFPPSVVTALHEPFHHVARFGCQAHVQFPVRLCFAVTVHRSQVQTLKSVVFVVEMLVHVHVLVNAQ